MNTLTVTEIDNVLNSNGYDTLVESNEYGDTISIIVSGYAVRIDCNINATPAIVLNHAKEVADEAIKITEDKEVLTQVLSFDEARNLF